MQTKSSTIAGKLLLCTLTLGIAAYAVYFLGYVVAGVAMGGPRWLGTLAILSLLSLPFFVLLALAWIIKGTRPKGRTLVFLLLAGIGIAYLTVLKRG